MEVPPSLRRLALAVALAWACAVVVVDVLSGERVVFIGLIVLSPLLVGIAGTTRQSVAVACGAVVAAALSGFWNDSFEDWYLWVPLCAVTLSSIAGVAVAWLRRRTVEQVHDISSLSGELSAAERRLDTILTQIDAAIMARDTEGRLVYANRAAAEILKLPDPQAIAAASSAELMALFEVYDEDGDPVALEDLPGFRVLAGDPEPAPVVVRNIVKATGEERWLLNKATPVRDDDGRVVMAVNVIEDITAMRRREIGQSLLANALRTLSSSLDLDETLQAVADMAVPGLADWAGVDLPDGRGGLRTVAVAHRDPARAALGWRLRREYPVADQGESGLLHVLRTGRHERIAEVTDEMLVAGAVDDEHLRLLRALGLRSTLVVPMLAGDEVVGVLSFVSSTARRFDGEDVQLALDLGRQAGVAVRNAQLFTERSDIAHTLQVGLLPGMLPAVPGWELEAFYQPAGLATEAGGDFYDAVRSDDGWVLVIGDVAGKGAAAATLTAVARYTLRTAIELTGDPLRALSHLNGALLDRPSLSLCSVALVRLRDDADEVEVVVAGHPHPLRRSGAAVASVGVTGPMVGAFGDATWTPASTTLRPGDALLLFTDGVPDTVGIDDRFGAQRLLAVVRDAGGGAHELVAAVRDATARFCHGAQPDDIALLALRRLPVRELA